MSHSHEPSGKTTSTKQNLNINNKDPCKEPTHFCKYCDEGFTSSSSMYKHRKTSCPEIDNKNVSNIKKDSDVKIDKANTNSDSLIETTVNKETKVCNKDKVDKETKVNKKDKVNKETIVDKETKVSKKDKVDKETKIDKETKVSKKDKVDKETKVDKESKVSKKDKVGKEMKVNKKSKIDKEDKIIDKTNEEKPVKKVKTDNKEKPIKKDRSVSKMRTVNKEQSDNKEKNNNYDNVFNQGIFANKNMFTNDKNDINGMNKVIKVNKIIKDNKEYNLTNHPNAQNNTNNTNVTNTVRTIENKINVMLIGTDEAGLAGLRREHLLAHIMQKGLNIIIKTTKPRINPLTGLEERDKYQCIIVNNDDNPANTVNGVNTLWNEDVINNLANVLSNLPQFIEQAGLKHKLLQK